MSIDPRFIITLKNKQFVLFAGLLDLAHQQGLKAIETQILPLSDPKSETWIVQATGTFRTSDGDAVWSAHGDASPGNSQMRGAYLRHAETRAAARMLRLATNVGMCSVEELGPDIEEAGNGQHAVPVQPGVAGSVGEGVRNEPSAGGPGRAPARAPAAPAAGAATAPARCSVEGCGKYLTQMQRDTSLHRWGVLYCREHFAGMAGQEAGQQ